MSEKNEPPDPKAPPAHAVANHAEPQKPCRVHQPAWLAETEIGHLAAMVHQHVSGASDCDHPDTVAEAVAYLEKRLKRWREPTHPYDAAVREQVRIALAEYREGRMHRADSPRAGSTHSDGEGKDPR